MSLRVDSRIFSNIFAPQGRFAEESCAALLHCGIGFRLRSIAQFYNPHAKEFATL
ncbi:hypothetical protein [Maliponia aquimaris]|uniref:hypothetical protein n=1 Tax=Maliponia aquimaris TaxID=1673631 RepID=UPI001595378F|nr:hypothetical protein [Maliponia aquimaris]